MKDTGSRISRRLQIGSLLKVIDNSGAQIVSIVSVKGYRGVKNRYGKGGVGNIFTGSVKVGKPDMKHKLFKCLIVQQRGGYRRPDGMRIKFDDNAAILIKDEKTGEPKGTVIKGPIPKEIVDRWKKVGKIASIVV